MERDALWYRVCGRRRGLRRGPKEKEVEKRHAACRAHHRHARGTGELRGSSTKTDPGTPAGTYNLTLVATSGNATYTTTLPVTVQ